jgi:hypothetical protein
MGNAMLGIRTQAQLARHRGTSLPQASTALNKRSDVPFERGRLEFVIIKQPLRCLGCQPILPLCAPPAALFWYPSRTLLRDLCLAGGALVSRIAVNRQLKSGGRGSDWNAGRLRE